MTRRRGPARTRQPNVGDSGPASHRPIRANLLRIAAVAALLGSHALLAITSTRDKCATFDEVAHLTKGYFWWRTGDRRLLPDHPPLAQAWAALPLLNDGLTLPSLDQPAWYQSDIYTLGKQFFYRVGNDPDALLRQARPMIVILSVLGGLAVFLWSRRIFGDAGGFVSLAMYAFSPTLLAHGRLVTTDTAAMLFFLLAVAALWHLMHRISPLSLLAATAALTGLVLAKMSAVLILPIALLLLIVRVAVGQPLEIRLHKTWLIARRVQVAPLLLGTAVLQLATVWLLTWAAFGFRYDAMPTAQPDRDRFFVPAAVPAGQELWVFQGRGIPHVAAVVNFARRHRLVPESYLYGFLSTMQAARGRDAFLDGDRRLTGWWYFFPLCFLYKVPLPTMGLLLAAGAAALVALPRPQANPGQNNAAAAPNTQPTWYAALPLWTLLVVYWAVAITSHLNIGHRHLLPTFAPMFILCGAAAYWLRSPQRWLRPVAPILLGLLVLTSLRTWPHYLAHFNLIAGGPANGYRHLVDSSLDWGQDLPGLQRCLAENAANEPVYVAYFGTGDWRHYGIRARALPLGLRRDGEGDYHLAAGWYCISATRLQQVYMLDSTRWTEQYEREYQTARPAMDAFARASDEQRATLLRSQGDRVRPQFDRFQRLQFGRLCAHLRERAPDAHVGHSILIYHLGQAEIAAALN